MRDHSPPKIPIEGCAPVAVRANADDRGCLFEIFREEWRGAFKTVQWNACGSLAGVMRGVHVHVDYDEFYTLPVGRVFLALRDVRRTSPTFGYRMHTSQRASFNALENANLFNVSVARCVQRFQRRGSSK